MDLMALSCSKRPSVQLQHSSLEPAGNTAGAQDTSLARTCSRSLHSFSKARTRASRSMETTIVFAVKELVLTTPLGLSPCTLPTHPCVSKPAAAQSPSGLLCHSGGQSPLTLRLCPLVPSLIFGDRAQNRSRYRFFSILLFSSYRVVAPRHRAGPMPYSFLHIAALRNDVVKAQQLIDGEVLCAPARLWAR